MKKIIVLLIVLGFVGCGFMPTAKVDYIIDGVGNANVSYILPNGEVEVVDAALPLHMSGDYVAFSKVGFTVSGGLTKSASLYVNGELISNVESEKIILIYSRIE